MNTIRKIVLIQNWFNSKTRHDEYTKTLQYNIDNMYIDKIVLLVEDTPNIDPSILKNKVDIVKVKRQPTYGDYFNYINEEYYNWICVLGNLDIMYTDSIITVHEYIDDDTVIALSRYEINPDNSLTPMTGGEGSQDTWIFKSKIRVDNMASNFTMGIGGCDNRIAYELQKNYKVINPCSQIISMHMHRSNIRTWDTQPILNLAEGYSLINPT